MFLYYQFFSFQKNKKVFLNSESDVFHRKKISDEYKNSCIEDRTLKLEKIRIGLSSQLKVYTVLYQRGILICGTQGGELKIFIEF